jgi:integrase
MKLNDAAVKKLPTPVKGNRIAYDDDVKGFGIRVTANGARSFVLNYRTKTGRERRYTIGTFPNWKVKAARDEAKALKRRVEAGQDPQGELQGQREAPTVADLCERYLAEHAPKKRARSRQDDAGMIVGDIAALRHLKVAEVEFADIERLHRKITERGAPYRANRVLALLSTMFKLARQWGMRPDNPVADVPRNQEAKRKRYLSKDEIASLTDALATYEDQAAANIIRMLLLTGARRGEVERATWDQIELESGYWTKPASTTKQKTEHRVKLSAPVLQLLSGIERDGTTVFPRRRMEMHWTRICKAAGISGARMHDLRHTFASIGASSGYSLPVLGALLGHNKPETTARYAHLYDDVQARAVETIGAIVTGNGAAEVHKLKRQG